MGDCCSKGGNANDASTTDRTKTAETGKTPLVGADAIAAQDAALYGGNTAAAAAEPASPSDAPLTPSITNVFDAENSGSVTSDSNDTEVDELHRVNASELGKFVIKKMNNKTLDRLWKHLDEDQTGHISREEVLNILQWMSVLYVAFRFRVCSIRFCAVRAEGEWVESDAFLREEHGHYVLTLLF